MTTISVLSTFLQLKMANSLMASVPTGSITDYKGLVCVFLHGGNDSFNMLTPYLQSEYDLYQAVRSNLALDRNSLLPIVDSRNAARGYGLNPLMPEVESLYNNDHLAFIANIGTLVQPTSISDYGNNIGLPQGLFSHLEQQLAWQSSVPDTISQTGWIGRMGDLLNDSSTTGTETVAMNISGAGVNLLQAGLQIGSVNVGSAGANTLGDYNNTPSVKQAIDKSLTTNYKSVLKNHYNHIRKETVEQTNLIENATSGVSLATVFPNTSIGQQLKQAALSIAARDQLGVKRQTFFVSLGGFDTHAGLLASHNIRLPQLSAALQAFNNAMIELGVHDNVMTYTASDFGRSLTSNGDGTDHGWGGNQMVMGGALKATKTIYGAYPGDLSLGSATDVGRGRQLPTTSVDQLHAELAHWYGIPNDSNMELILPNIRNFWAAGAAPTLGLFS